MPFPLQPNGYTPEWGEQKDTSGAGLLGIDPEALFSALDPSGGLKKQALATDYEADVLFSLWHNSEVVKQADTAEEKIYAVPDDFDNNEILRLKAAGLVWSDGKTMTFSARAAKVIQTMVLSAPNDFQVKSIKKPYSLILADTLSPKRTNNLALASQMYLEAGKGVPNAKGVPLDRKPTSDSVWVWNTRLVNIDGKHYKEYSVRVYKNQEGSYDIWAFNGKIGGGQTAQPKGIDKSYNQAVHVAQQCVNEKTYGGYESAADTVDYKSGFPFESVSPVVPGKAGNQSSPAPAKKPDTPKKKPHKIPQKKAPVKQKKEPDVAPPPKAPVVHRNVIDEALSDSKDYLELEDEYGV